MPLIKGRILHGTGPWMGQCFWLRVTLISACSQFFIHSDSIGRPRRKTRPKRRMKSSSSPAASYVHCSCRL